MLIYTSSGRGESTAPAVNAPAVRESAAAQQRGPLVVVLALVAGYAAIEAVGGWRSGSLGLVADAAHLLTDAAGIALSLGAIWLAARPAGAQRTFGHYRAEVLAALANAVLMLGVAAWVLWEAWRRLLAPPEIAAGTMLLIATGGLLVNGLAAWLLRRGAGTCLNARAAFLEVLSDLLASAGVLVAGAITAATGWRYADPLISAAIALFIVPRAWHLLRRTTDVLLEAPPPHVTIAEVEAALLAVPGVRAVHDLHVWTITSGMESVTAHLVLEEGLDLRRGQDVLRAATHRLGTQFGLDHATLQLEIDDLHTLEVAH